MIAIDILRESLHFSETAIPGNVSLLLAVVDHFRGLSVYVLKATFALFEPRLFIVQALLCAGWRWHQRHQPGTTITWVSFRREAAFCLICFIACVGAVGLLKITLQIPRPEYALQHFIPRLSAGDPFGFPSGHAAIAAAVAFVLWRRASTFGRAVLAAMVAWVMTARCIAGLHFPFDVLSGAVIALVTAACISLIYRLWRCNMRSSEHHVV
ncbi:phosphatase PAP2 family protein [Pollutimonas bauzanensis]|uniref:PAP2 superfamily protein n=1 Tax=Pollutimonas bauzanensis TaxID=658167 RepID=A0A1M5Y1R3_9BURK|nr:phosphatase PAP2 family protein [Pollutimonas bauzanensis]SHI05987.1 PAP2 superfamily protein [Pollutimonas bauzanensis]SHI39331.1 PAP2 superfamily protein [Pollutimonas bauzanensis]